MTPQGQPVDGGGAPSALHELRSYLTALGPLLADPEWDGLLPPPPDLASLALRPEEWEAAEHLRADLECLRLALDGRMIAVRAELDTMGSRRQAARRYLTNDAAAPRR